MKTKFFKNCISNIPAVAVIFTFLIFSSLKQPGDEPAPAAKPCCTGYCMPLDSLHRFMQDSLGGIQFEGGTYSKTDLLVAINHLNNGDDSLYILNVLVGCDVTKGTDLVITSKHTPGVNFISKTKRGCTDCPPKACCPKSVGVARIIRGCIDYKDYHAANVESQTNILSAAQ